MVAKILIPASLLVASLASAAGYATYNTLTSNSPDGGCSSGSCCPFSAGSDQGDSPCHLRELQTSTESGEHHGCQHESACHAETANEVSENTSNTTVDIDNGTDNENAASSNTAASPEQQ